MADKTSIEWTDATWSPTTGCVPVSEGCANCWARRQAERFWHRQYPAISTGAGLHCDGDRPRAFSDVQCHEDRLAIPLRWRRPRKIAVSLMGDLFHPDVPDDFIDRAFAVMALCPQHTFQVLTKRPERMRQYFSVDRHELIERVEAQLWDMHTDATTNAVGRWPLPNVWIGVSCENQATADERIPLLLQTPAAVRFVSLEPLLGAIDLDRIERLDDGFHASALQGQHDDNLYQFDTLLDWVIVGGESGPKARPCEVDWIRSIVRQCQAANVPCFVKQLGALPIQQCGQCGRTVGRVMGGWVDACGPTHAVLIAESQRVRNGKGADPSEWPADLRVRQMPEAHGR